MSTLSPARFAEFYKAVNQKLDDPTFGPFPWQQRLVERVADPGRHWPRAVALPTAAGKTACIDVAVFALACQAGLGADRTAPRRIFFVVDRRVVVDQAFEHAKKLAAALVNPPDGILREVAGALCRLAGEEDGRPLDVYALRGGTYRETAWARSPLQPTVIASTVDQVGSRLLFRGYGVSDSMKPVHAGLVGNDALILLDEAHCARPFDQTARSVEIYREWGETDGRPPFRFVSITATPGTELPGEEIERDTEADREHPVLGPRIAASKPARLIVAEKATGKKHQPELVKVLAEQARALAKGGAAAVGVIVNRVATARLLAKELGAVLLTGRMRPLDRDRVVGEKLGPLVSNAGGTPPPFVVATQCIEVGADFDFHALVTECASLDALRQRFGRLNRVAARPTAAAVVVIRGDQIEDTSDDPVYGASLATTWTWLKAKAVDGVFDFGVAAVRVATAGEELGPLNAPAPDAPVLFPAHLDCWVQTSPVPAPDPDPAVFLHGPNTSLPDVQAVFRADLGENAGTWAEIVALCPPSSAEALPVRLDVFRRWLAGADGTDESGDVEGETRREPEDDELPPTDRRALRWAGPEAKETVVVTDPREIRPGDTLVLPTTAPGVNSLGDFLPGPDGQPTVTDPGDEAYQRSRDKAILRCTPGLRQLAGIPEFAEERDAEFERAVSEALIALAESAPEEWVRRAAGYLANPRNRTVDPHPAGGLVVTGKSRLFQFDPTYLDDSEPAESFRGRAVSLVEHSCGVAHYATRFAEGSGLPAKTYTVAGLYHDLGKLDPRFQAMVKQSSPRTAVGVPLAKSAKSPRSKQERDEARQVHRYPPGARHELLSTAIVGKQTSDDLLLHLIATHHGFARPFVEPIDDETDVPGHLVRHELLGLSFPDHSPKQDVATWNIELPERFWRVVRAYGWWGAAHREAVFRLADHAQSRAEQDVEERAADAKAEDISPPPLQPFAASQRLHSIPCTGLDGSNPLAFLAALGTLRVLTDAASGSPCPAWLAGGVRLSWGVPRRPTTPVLHLAESVDAAELSRFLAECMGRELDTHPARRAVALVSAGGDEPGLLTELRPGATAGQRAEADWVAALCSSLAPEAASQLLMVRRDYLDGNVRSILRRTTDSHIRWSLFLPWDYADALDNQSLHWEPSEDRRHAYQWHQPNGDPTRKQRGGMLGANRLAVEAWPLFVSVPDPERRLRTRGFTGTRANNTSWTWPLWRGAISLEVVASVLALRVLQDPQPDPAGLRAFGILGAFRSRRILVGKTPNLTPPAAV
ncbi:MAG: CRISPR-associated helicase Cas3, subtype Dpsyc [Gemmataceae bacterium]|nr:CRISPR-associated helicase Cas3, subtype Dpsyc [Gemmataceae bacterium]